ncbi:serine hydrolase domain-containing protein [Polyangium aurulentum]|uniref:serine hydrolase domain-containing protein n=1 Tax=Polyangium aurulentum TaxID=2567896 RepID=UPI00146B6861|nr:serine hydrolase domain-containing protein [Polyangium aurulentum]UQA54596.1 beta-lactamase family protein [Polyangium aurulentum]
MRIIRLVLLALASCAPAAPPPVAPASPAPVSLGPAPAPAPEPIVSPEMQSIDALIARQVSEKKLVGLSVAVMREGELLLAKGYGKRSLPEGRPVDTDTMFGIGSVTKQFTCAIILLLAEEGKLSVGDKVSKYFPDLTRAGDVTLLDLMNNVSGYPDYYPLDFVDRRMAAPISTDELIRKYGGSALDFPPGTRYSYSNTGFVMLGRVAEKVTGEPFGALLARRIFEPLGMKNTRYEPDPSGDAHARGYATFALGPPEDPLLEGKGWLSAAAAMYSTASDLARWDLALVTGKVLKPASYALMTSPRKLADGKLSSYGCGLAVRTREGATVLSHDGAVAGFNALNMMIPGTRSAVVMISNLEASDALGALHQSVVDAVFPVASASDKPAAEKKPPPAPPGLPRVAGPAAVDMARELFRRLQEGRIDRKHFSDEFNAFLTDERARGAAERLGRYGEPSGVELWRQWERGGMEVSRARFTFGERALLTLMYRTPDGKVQQFFVSAP